MGPSTSLCSSSCCQRCTLTSMSGLSLRPAMDIILQLFAKISSLSRLRMQASIRRLARLLRPGGVMLLRDYGRYDMAQLRFKKGCRDLNPHMLLFPMFLTCDESTSYIRIISFFYLQNTGACTYTKPVSEDHVAFMNVFYHQRKVPVRQLLCPWGWNTGIFLYSR